MPRQAADATNRDIQDEKLRVIEMADPVSLGQLIEHNVQAATDDSKAAAMHKLAKEATSQFGFNPTTAFALIVVPPALLHFGVSPWVSMPIATVVLLYLQAKKDRQDRKAAIGIVTDPDLMQVAIVCG